MRALVDQCKRESEALEMLEVPSEFESDTQSVRAVEADTSQVLEEVSRYNEAIQESRQVMSEAQVDAAVDTEAEERLREKERELTENPKALMLKDLEEKAKQMAEWMARVEANERKVKEDLARENERIRALEQAAMAPVAVAAVDEDSDSEDYDKMLEEARRDQAEYEKGWVSSIDPETMPESAKLRAMTVEERERYWASEEEEKKEE